MNTFGAPQCPSNSDRLHSVQLPNPHSIIIHAPPLQASKMGDVRLKQHVSEVLAAYHPFWLRLGLEIVVSKAVPTQSGAASRLYRSRAELEAFAREEFLNDADLALQRAGNKAQRSLHNEAYWVGTKSSFDLYLILIWLQLSTASCATVSGSVLVHHKGT